MSDDDLRDDRGMRVVRAYRPGSWFGVLGERTSVLLPPTQRHRVAALWQLADDGASFDEVLDALLVSGLRELPAFVLWGRTPDGLRVLLRGDARVSALSDGDPVQIEGSGSVAWVEQTLPEDTTLTVVLEEGDTSLDLLVDAGLVRLGALREPAGSEPQQEVAAEALPQPVHDPVSVPEPQPQAQQASEPVAPSALEQEPWPGDDPLMTEPIQILPSAEPSQSAPAPVGEAASEPDPSAAVDPFAPPPPPSAPAGPFAPPFGGQPPAPDASTPPAWPEPQWAPSPYPAPPPPPDAPAWGGPAPEGPGEQRGDADHDGMTRAGGWEPDQFVRHHPGIPGQPPAPSVVSRPVARLIISSGDTIEVDRVILVGRAPEARRFTSTEQPRLVTVPSPQKEISSTHLEIRPGSGADHGTAIVTDMGSTNGTVLAQPGLPPEDLHPGVAVQLIPGAVLDLGDSVTIQVTGP